MDAGTQQGSLNVATGVAGRKDADGTEKRIELQPLRKKLRALEVAFNRAADARDDFNEAIKNVAEETGLMSSAVKRLVKARVNDKVFDEKRKADQASMLFDVIGGEDPDRQLDYSDSHDTGAAAKPRKNGAGKKSAATGPAAPIGEGEPPAVDPLKGTDLEAGAGPKLAAPPEGKTFDKYLAEKGAPGGDGQDPAPVKH